MRTLLLDIVLWDLVLDVDGNIAVASDPYSQAQDAASAIRTFINEAWYDTTLGINYFGDILGKSPPVSLIKADMVAEAETVPGVVTARVFLNAIENRKATGQVQITNQAGQAAVVNL
jgi:hypothetical protein